MSVLLNFIRPLDYNSLAIFSFNKTSVLVFSYNCDVTLILSSTTSINILLFSNSLFCFALAYITFQKQNFEQILLYRKTDHYFASAFHMIKQIIFFNYYTWI